MKVNVGSQDIILRQLDQAKAGK